jgi:hypothetical protein
MIIDYISFFVVFIYARTKKRYMIGDFLDRRRALLAQASEGRNR